MRMSKSLSVCYLLVQTLQAQPDWPAIKAATAPIVALPNEYGTPFQQPLAVGGWEDGLYISREGLHLYCFYTPIDFWSFTDNGGEVSNFTPFRWEPDFGMDLVTNQFGFSEWLHSDILTATRNSVDEPFKTWQLSNLARPEHWEGAPYTLMANDTLVDIFAFTSDDTKSGNADPWFLPRKDQPTSVANGPRQAAPKGFQLLQNYPNPFNPETTIQYQLSGPDRVTLAIYNLMGRKCARW